MNSYVLKVVIDANSKTATSVQFERKGRIYNVRASKEVIMAAGAVSTPQILMVIGAFCFMITNSGIVRDDFSR